MPARRRGTRHRAARRLRRLLLLGVAVLAAGTALALEAGALWERAELASVDTRFRVRGAEPPPRDLVVVAIDDATLDELDKWPLPRGHHADAIDRIAADGPRAIVYDVQFTEPSGDDAADNALIEAARAARRIALTTTEVDEEGATKVFGGGEALEYSGATVGNGLVPEARDGALRRLPYAVAGLRTLAVATVQDVLGRPLARSALAGEGAWIDYLGPPGTIRRISFADVVRGRLASGTFRDRIVVVGAVAPSLQDLHDTVWPGAEMPGPEVHANAISTLLRGLPLRETSGLAGLLLALGLALVAPLAGLVLRPLWAVVTPLAAALGYAVAAQLLFDAGWIVPVVAPLVGLAVGFVGSALAFWLTAMVERAQTRELFARFVPDSVVATVLDRASHDGELRLGGERLDATVMFSDLRGFTTFAEARDPEQVIDVLNRYLTEMSDAILDHGGTLVAYMGDGIMAVFGAPVTLPDHAERALAAARDMLGRLDRFNAWMREQGLGDGFKVGIGLHSGAVMSGNVGSARRLEYTAIGDTTNTAARLEDMTKGTPHQLFVADSTRERLQVAPGDLEAVGELDVRGRTGAIRVWGLANGHARAHHAAHPVASDSAS
jgi:adenylate cyclase